MKKLSITILLCLLLLPACSQHKELLLSGYIEGEYTFLASSVAGALVQLNVHRGQTVKQGDLIFKLDPQPEEAELDVANARLLELQVDLELAGVQFARQVSLYENHATSKVAYDIAEADYEAKQNQYLELKADITHAQWSYNQKTMFAPVGGEVFDTFFRLGEQVDVSEPVVALLAPANIHVLFYIPEPDLSTIHLGQTIQFDCDGCHGRTQAVIDYISPEAEYTPPVIYSQASRQELVYLVRADMPAKVAVRFHPGQPVDVYVKLRQHKENQPQ